MKVSIEPLSDQYAGLIWQWERIKGNMLWSKREQ